MNKRNIYFKLFLITFFISCGSVSQGSEEDEAEILKMHYAQQTYHFEKMAHEFASQLSEDFISLNRGVVSQQSYDDHVARYNSYFAAVEFEKWEDTTEPIIRFSDDNSLAYTIVQKDVVVTYPNEAGVILRDSVHYAWLAIYRKNSNGDWKIESVASTNAEPVVSEN